MTEPAITHRRRQSVPAALAWMTLALSSFIMVAIAGREAGRSIDATQMTIWRGFFGLVILLAVGLAMGRTTAALKTRVLHLHFFRNSVHFAAQFAWLKALTIIQLAELFALEFTTPIWVAVLAPIFLSERLTFWRAMAALLGFAGTLVVVLMPEAVRASGLSISGGSVFALLSAVGFALALMTTKRLTRTEDVFTILLYMMLMQAAFSGVLALRYFMLPDFKVLAWMFLLAGAGLAAHFGIAQAFARADAIIVAPMDFLRLPLIALVGSQVYGESLDRWVLIGGIGVLAANAINLLGERKARPGP